MKRIDYKKRRQQHMLDMMEDPPKSCYRCFFFQEGAYNDTYRYYCFIQYHEMPNVNIPECNREILLKQLLKEL